MAFSQYSNCDNFKILSCKYLHFLTILTTLKVVLQDKLVKFTHIDKFEFSFDNFWPFWQFL